MSNPYRQRLEFARQLALTAGPRARDYFRRLADLKIERKGHQDMVSEADRGIERFLREAIEGRFPDDGIQGEEYGEKPGASGMVWVIDPIDGTTNFLSGIPSWTIVLACCEAGRAIAGVIHDPNVEETFHAGAGGGAFLNGRPIRVAANASLTRGSVGAGFSNRVPGVEITRFIDALVESGGVFFRNGSGAAMLAYVAAGRLLGYYEPHMNAWDCLAGLLLVEEAGGRILPYAPQTVLQKGCRVLAAAPQVFDELQQLSAA